MVTFPCAVYSNRWGLHIRKWYTCPNETHSLSITLQRGAPATLHSLPSRPFPSSSLWATVFRTTLVGNTLYQLVPIPTSFFFLSFSSYFRLHFHSRQQFFQWGWFCVCLPCFCNTWALPHQGSPSLWLWIAFCLIHILYILFSSSSLNNCGISEINGKTCLRRRSKKIFYMSVYFLKKKLYLYK